jgi:hypothetical protein
VGGGGGDVSAAHQYCCSRDLPLGMRWTRPFLGPPLAPERGPRGRRAHEGMEEAREAGTLKPPTLAPDDLPCSAGLLLGLICGRLAAHFLTASAHQGWSRTCCTVRRLAGSTTSSLEIRSLATSETLRQRSSGLKTNLPLTTW